MNHFYFSRNLDNGKAIFISPITDADIEASGDTVEDAGGYFIYQRSYCDLEPEVTVLAKLHSEEAALELSALLGLS